MSIVVSHLSYTYGTRPAPALRDVSVTFKAGELTLIAGASGCGKTTLVRCINGLIPRSYTRGRLEGAVSLFGHANTGMPLAKISQLVGTVLQDPERQIVATRVVNEIAFGLENLGLPRQQILDRIQEVAQLLKIEYLLDRDTHRLSGGEKQKVALAGVLAMRPQALLLDEPLASLDPASGYEALQLMRRLAGSGIAVVVIEHRVEDVLAVHPDRCVYMRDGTIAYDGDSRGIAQAVDWREVKLPAPAVIERVRKERREARGKRQEVGGQRSVVSIGDSALSPERSGLSTQGSGLPSPLLEFRNVCFRYGDGPEVLHDASLVIHSGDVVAVLGPNGAGKTTLVKHAIGLNRPTSGQVLVEGRDSRALTVAQIARAVGYVFQSPSHMLFAPTVREELSFGPANVGLNPEVIRHNVAQALSTVNLSEYLDSPPLALSFGQQKRVGIAAILAMRPRVLVMDEPTAGQDYASYTAFMNDILGKDEGSPSSSFTLHPSAFDAVIFITHDLDLAITYANRVLLVAGGRLVADGAPEVVLARRELLEQCRIRPTSLLEANLSALPRTGRFVAAPALASLED